MMDAELQQEYNLIAETARQFSYDSFPQVEESSYEFPHESLKQASELGFLDCAIPEPQGGSGIELYGLILLLSNLAEGSPSFATLVATHLSVTYSLASKGVSPVLPTAGKTLDPKDAIYGIAIPEWTGAPKVTKKTISGSFICPISPVNCRYVAFVLPETEAITLFESKHLLDHQTESYCGSGLDELPYKRLQLKNFSLSKATVIPDQNSASELASIFQLLLAAVQVGNARAALTIAIEYAKERKQTARTIIDHQNVRALLMKQETGLNAATSFVQQTAMDSNLFHGSYNLCRQTYTFAGEIAEAVCLDSVQTLGGYGYMKDYGLERKLRDCKTLQAMTGDHLFAALGIQPYV